MKNNPISGAIPSICLTCWKTYHTSPIHFLLYILSCIDSVPRLLFFLCTGNSIRRDWESDLTYACLSLPLILPLLPLPPSLLSTLPSTPLSILLFLVKSLIFPVKSDDSEASTTAQLCDKCAREFHEALGKLPSEQHVIIPLALKKVCYCRITS